MNTATQKEWQLMAIHGLAERGRRKSFGNKDINEELRMMPELSDRDAETIISSGGFRRKDLENEKLLKRTVRQGKNAWALTAKGKIRVCNILRGKAKNAEKQRAVDALARAGIDPEAIWVLEQTQLTGAELEQLLAQQGKHAIADQEPAPHDNLEVEAQAIEFIIEKDNRQWHRARRKNQKGYDLEERDAKGNVVAWCEVKAINGPFALSQGVALSDAQFKMAFEKHEAYWLYIVENVGDPDNTRVFAIRNPASQVKRFVFRCSWRFAATRVF